MGSGQHPEAALHGIACNGLADGFGYGQTQTTIRRLFLIMSVVGHQIVHDDVLATDFAPALQHGDKITMALQPLHLDYAAVVMVRPNQADRVLRPLARRRLISARPERVRMRRRKPCFM